MTVAAALAAMAQVGADAARLLEEAIHREIVLGDLRGAIESYRRLLELPGGSPAVAARAQFRIGQCEEKLGDRAAAEEAYHRLADQYGDQEQAAEARAKLAEWQEAGARPQNLNFKEGTAGRYPPGWIPMALPKDMDFLAQLQRQGCRSGPGCVVVQVPPSAPRPVADLMQSFTAAPYRGQSVRLRAWMRVEGVEPDDHGQMWLTVERPSGRKGFFDNMDDRPVRTGEWTRCEIVGEVDRDAQFIQFGFMSIGKGRVWVDEVTFQVLGR